MDRACLSRRACSSCSCIGSPTIVQLWELQSLRDDSCRKWIQTRISMALHLNSSRQYKCRLNENQQNFLQSMGQWWLGPFCSQSDKRCKPRIRRFRQDETWVLICRHPSRPNPKNYRLQEKRRVHSRLPNLLPQWFFRVDQFSRRIRSWNHWLPGERCASWNYCHKFKRWWY